MAVTIRCAEVKDVVQVFDLWKRLIQEEKSTFEGRDVYPHLDFTKSEAVLPWFNRFAETLYDSDTRCWVAVVENKIVGFVTAVNYEREQVEPHKFIYVREMYVLPEARQKIGVARALESVVEEWAAQVRADVIECHCVATDKQISRWTRKGFTPYNVALYRTAKWKETM